ncbi:hypothetical protein ACEQPO_03435 [Bacillus sp. SL00103]
MGEYPLKISLGLIYGGKSAEHNVSLQTALAVTKHLTLRSSIYINLYYRRGRMAKRRKTH